LVLILIDLQFLFLIVEPELFNVYCVYIKTKNKPDEEMKNVYKRSARLRTKSKYKKNTVSSQKYPVA